jgi:anti-sigma B factor antagonist
MLETQYNFRYLKCGTDQGVLVLTVTESSLLDDAVINVIRNDLLGAIADFAINKVVVDFQNVRFISSAAFRPLFSLHRRINELNGKFVICGLTGMVAEVFHLTGLTAPAPGAAAPFLTAPDVAAAVEMLKKSQS